MATIIDTVIIQFSLMLIAAMLTRPISAFFLFPSPRVVATFPRDTPSSAFVSSRYVFSTPVSSVGFAIWKVRPSLSALTVSSCFAGLLF